MPDITPAARVTSSVHVIDLDLNAADLPQMTIATAIGPVAVTPVGVRLSYEVDEDDATTTVRINGRTGDTHLDYYYLSDDYQRPAWLAALVEEYRPASRAAVLREAAAAAAGCFDGLTPEEERPGYDGPTIDPEDRLREAIDPRVGLGRRERVIAEHRQMVTDEIVAKLQSLAAPGTAGGE